MLRLNSSDVPSFSLVPRAATPEAVMVCVALVVKVVVGPANTNAMLRAGIVSMPPDQAPIVTNPVGPVGPVGPVDPAGPVAPVRPAGPVGPVWPAFWSVSLASCLSHWRAL